MVTAIHFKSSDDVEAGALLFNIDDSVEQADLANGLAQLKNADATLARQKTLVAQGNTAQSTVDTALATRDLAAATVERTRAVIAQKAITAPFAGRLGLSKVDLGQYVAVGTSIVTLQQLDPIYVDFPAPEEALRTLAVGQRVNMTVDAIPGHSFNGKIAAIDARVSPDTRNLMVRAVFANPDHKLLPGMFANLTSRPASPLRADRAAHGDHFQSLRRQCFRRQGARMARAGRRQRQGGPSGLIVERRFVQVGPARGERVAIQEGVRAGELVVTSGQIKLQAYAGHDRRDGRASAASRNAPAVTDRR